MKRLFFVLTIFLAARFSLQGQVERLFTTDKELSSSLVKAVFQDSRGFVWICTEDGLNRTDGVLFTRYKHLPKDSTSLKNNYVRSIHEDSQGRLWIGCINGIQLYDYDTDSFSELPLYNNERRVAPHIMSIIELDSHDILLSTSGHGIFRLRSGASEFISDDFLNESIGTNFVNLVFEDSERNIWMATERNGLFCFYHRDKSIKSFEYFSSKGNAVSVITEDHSGEIFAGTRNGGLFKYCSTSKDFSAISSPTADSKNITCIITDAQNRIFVGTDGDGLKVYDRTRGTLENYEPVTTSFDYSRMKIHALMQDKDRNLWVGLFQKGVAIIPTVQSNFKYIGHKSYRFNAIGSNCVMALQKDAKGNLWVGTDNDGLYCVSPSYQQTKHFRSGLRRGSGTSKGGIDPRGGGTSKGGIDPNGAGASKGGIVLDGSGDSGQWGSGTTGSDTPSTVICLCEDSQGRLWAGSYYQGLSIIDKETGRATYIPSLSSTQVNYIMEDSQHRIWVSTHGFGIYIIGADLRIIRHITTNPQERSNVYADMLPNDWIYFTMEDSSHKIWIGCSNGMACYDPSRDSFINHLSMSNLLSGEVVNHILESSAGKIYAGTSEGLFIFDPTTEKIDTLTSRDGLSNDVICGMAEDADGNIWISTHFGISKYRPADGGKFNNYYASDGIFNNEFSRCAVYVDSDRRIYFGGTDGVTFFDPFKISEQQTSLDVRIISMNLYNKSVKKGDMSGRKPIMTSGVSETGSFHLSHKDNTFSFILSVFDFINPDKITYQYKVNEINKTWMSTSPGVNRIPFTALAPGKYTLSYFASINGISSPVKSVEIVIRQPWYWSTVAKLLYILVLLTLVYSYVHFASLRMKEKQERLNTENLNKLNESKLQFFINVAHEIRTPMTLIMSPLEKLLSSSGEYTPEAQSSFRLMYQNAQRILRLMNELMDLRKLDKGQMILRFTETNIIRYISSVASSFDYQAQKKQINYKFHHSADVLNVFIDRNNFDKVLVNLLSNAFKFTPEKGDIDIFVSVVGGAGCDKHSPDTYTPNRPDNGISVSKSPEKGCFDDTYTPKLASGSDLVSKSSLSPGQYLRIVISDSGIGVAADKTEKIFDRFYQISNSINASNFGTGVGLHFSKLLIEMHHGTIHVENHIGRPGCDFIIMVPLGYAHLRPDEIVDAADLQEGLASGSTEFLRTSSASSSNSAVSKPNKKSTIIIVEDEAEIRSYIRDELSSEYNFLEAADGKEGYETICRCKPDLIISDIMMPVMDGFAMCKKIRQNIQVNHIPILLLTAKSTIDDRILGMETGADAFIVKPFNMELLKSTIANLITTRRRLQIRFEETPEIDSMLEKKDLPSADEVFMSKVMNIINTNLTNPDLSVEMLADSIGMSRVNVYRKLKALTNQAARDFIRNIRLKQAANMLMEKKHTIADVAYATGFTNLSHFSTAFKDLYGLSPKEWAAQQHGC